MRPVPAVPMPLNIVDIWSAFLSIPGALARFEQECALYFGARRAWAVSSGRVALWLALQALKERAPQKKRVILPAYTCPTVGRAVLAAGLQGLCVDVSLKDFNLDVAKVAEVLEENVLAVVAPHMFGTPCDIDALAAMCAQAGVVLIEDLAQACGAKVKGRRIGTFGQMAFLSLGRSKNLRGAGGGVLLVNTPEDEEIVQQKIQHLASGGWLPVGAFAKQTAISLLARPFLWSKVRHWAFLNVGAEDQSFDSHPRRLSQWQAALSLRAFQRFERWNEIRRRLGQAIETELRDVPQLVIQEKAKGKECTYTRLATRLNGGRVKRDQMIEYLQKQNIDARAFYSRPMYQYSWWESDPQQKPCPAAEKLVAENLILPLYWGLNEDAAHQLGVRVRAILNP